MTKRQVLSTAKCFLLFGLIFLFIACPGDADNGAKTPESYTTEEYPNGEKNLFVEFSNIVSIKSGSTAEEISEKILTLTEDTTLKLNGGINAVMLKSILSAMLTNDSVKIALDLSDTTGIDEWKNWLSGAENLCAVSLPKTVTSVQSNAFTNCDKLQSVTVPCSIESYPNVPVPVNFKGNIADWLKSSVVVPSDKKFYLSGVDFMTVTELKISDSVTLIREGAFKNCSALKNVILPKSVTTVGKSAFEGCHSLESINLENVTAIESAAFKECLSLKDVNLINAASIGSSAFEKCASIKSINPGNIILLENSVFRDCTALTDVTLPEVVTSIEDYAFYGCAGLKNFTMPDGVKTVGNYVFYGCRSLTSMTLPNGVTKIGNSLFYECMGLTSVVIPDTVTDIGDYAFFGCAKLADIVFSKTLQNIGSLAFCGCSCLKTLTIPCNVIFIGSCAFIECTKLEEIIIEDSDVALIIEEAHNSYNGSYRKVKSAMIPNLSYNGYNSTERKIFDFCPLKKVYLGRSLTYAYDNSPFNGIETLTELTIGNKVTSISDSEFKNCKSLTVIAIPKAMQSIESSAFYGCSGLTDIKIPEGVTSIGSYAFYECTGLTNFTISETVTVIGDHAFDGSSKLKSIFYLGTEEQWNAVSINPDNNTFLQEVDVFFNYTGNEKPLEITASLSTNEPTNQNVIITVTPSKERLSKTGFVYSQVEKNWGTAKSILNESDFVEITRDSNGNFTILAENNGWYAVAFRDAYGFRASCIVNVSVIDRTAPQDVSDIKADYNRKSNSITVSWTNPTDEDFYCAVVSWTINGVVQDPDFSTGKSYTLKNVQNGEYSFTVCSKDKAGNKSSGSTVNVDISSYVEINGVQFKILTFGSWPQTIKADDVTITDETKTVGMFTYYKGSDGEWYAKVAENAYMPNYTYSNGTVVGQDGTSEKYFKVEPIEWRVLTNNYRGKRLLLAESILVNCSFYDYIYVNRNVKGVTVYPNNYEHSRIRAYLNGLSYQLKEGDSVEQVENSEFYGIGFLQTAFTDAERAQIETVTVDNSEAITNDNGNNLMQPVSYACDDTEDKIFLLSEQELNTEIYGFDTNPCASKGDTNNHTESSRIRVPTDFAKAKGAYHYVDVIGYGGSWWRRSPNYNANYEANSVSESGGVHCQYYYGDKNISEYVNTVRIGVVPALCLK